MTRVLGSALTFGLAYLAFGCADSPGNETGQADGDFLLRDSAGILIAETNREAANSALGWVVDPTPNLTIGAYDDSSQGLYRVRGVQTLPQRGILVVDGGSRELRFFDADGNLRHRVGRKGEGPGEFDTPVLVPWPGVDSLLVWDTRLMRFQVFSEEGLGQRTISLTERWPSGGRAPLGAAGREMLVRRSQGDWVVPASQQTEGPKAEHVDFFWYVPETRTQTPLSSFTSLRFYVSISRGHPPAMMLIPFTESPQGATDEEGALITDGLRPEILEFDRSGQLRRIFRIDGPGRPVTDEMLDDFINDRATDEAGQRSMRALFAEMPIPDTLPEFQRIVVDDGGMVWAEVFPWHSGMQPVWVVFDDSGRALGKVQTPMGLEVQAIGEDFILGLWTDEMGVEFVHRYGLDRGVAGGLVS